VVKLNRRLSAILFDVDDTLIHLDPPITDLCAAACAANGVALREEDVASSFSDAVAFIRSDGLRYVGDDDALWTDVLSVMLAACGHDDPRGGLVRGVWSWVKPRLNDEVYPDVEPALIALRQHGLMLAAVTGRINSSAEVLDRLGVLGHLDSHTFAGELGVTKPDPLLYQTALGRIGVEAEKAMLVGDGPIDMIGAQAVGLLPVLIDRRGRRRGLECRRIEGLTQLVALADEVETGR
jgi:putative hydrolase of the HAD superfamily